MSKDTIYREDAINALEKLSACEEYGVEIGTDEETYIGKYEAITVISDLPSADRPQGEWLFKEITDDYHVTGLCSICKERRRIDNFCPNCGARMKGGRR